MIQIENIYKSFAQTQAVIDFSLNIEKTSIVGLIGPNGAGKTSLLRILATLYKPDQGKVFVEGHDIAQSPYKVRPLIGFMPNDFGHFGDMTIYEYVRFFGSACGISWKKIDQHVQEILELTDLTERANQLVIEGSTGIKQRACLAKTLIHNPKILLLDEPASGLDPRARIEIRELLKELKHLNKTIFLSSHILSDLEEVCTHFAFIDRGKLLIYGTKEELLEKKQEETTFQLEILPEDLEKVQNWVQKDESLKLENQEKTVLEISSTKWHGNQLLQQLLAMEVEIISFGKQKKALEDIFLQVTGRFS